MVGFGSGVPHGDEDRAAEEIRVKCLHTPCGVVFREALKPTPP